MLRGHRRLRVAVLCSHRAPGLLYLLNQRSTPWLLERHGFLLAPEVATL